MRIPTDSSDLSARHSALQAEAEHVLQNLDLDALLAPLGDPVHVGSAALGLMVWRDLDITVVCARLDLDAVASLGARIAAHPGIRQVLFRNDTGAWNTDPNYPDGLYLGLGYRAPDGQDWKIDIWFVDEPERQPDLAHLRSIGDRLTPETREAILRIKSHWASGTEYGKSVRSFDIYTAVLDGGVHTPEEFDVWLEARRTAG